MKPIKMKVYSVIHEQWLELTITKDKDGYKLDSRIHYYKPYSNYVPLGNDEPDRYSTLPQALVAMTGIVFVHSEVT